MDSFLKKGSLEDWFLSLKQEDFPGDINFVSIYLVAKNQIELKVLPEIKAIVSSINSDIYLNDHGPLHVKTVMLRASELLRRESEALNSMEGFVLLMAILLHDAGHVINGRKNHERTVSSLLKELYGDTSLTSVDTALQWIIYSLAKAHSGVDDPIGRLTDAMSWSSYTIRMKRLAAILRLADELAEDSLRASSFLLASGNPHLSTNSKLFHVYSDKLTSCDIDMSSHEVTERFLLNKDDVLNTHPHDNSQCFLVDYIYERSVKTFREITYCNRFLPETLRINRLSIKIDFIEKDSLEEFRDSISYRLQESGYPNHIQNTVFELASEGLFDTEGRKIDGQYLCTSLMETEQ